LDANEDERHAAVRIDPGAGDAQAATPVDRAQDVAVDGSEVWVLVSPRLSDPTLFEPGRPR
jgi:hypothetical protein